MYRADLIRATSVIIDDGVVCYPTEGVFGLGCLPDAAAAVARIIGFKGRSSAAGLILIGASPEHLEPWIAPDRNEQQNLFADTGKPTTWIVTASAATPDWVTGGRNTVAVRLCTHPLAAALCNATGSALVSTSANRSGHKPATTTIAARYAARECADAFVAGNVLQAGVPSEIRSARSNAVIRPG